MGEVEKMSIFGETKLVSPSKWIDPIYKEKWSKEFEYTDRIYYIPYADIDESDPEPPLAPALVLGQRHVKLILSPDLRHISYMHFLCAPIKDEVYSMSPEIIETGIVPVDIYTMFNERNTDHDEYSTHVSVSLLCALCMAFNKAKLSVKLLSQNAEVIENYVNEHIRCYNIDCGCPDYSFSYKKAVNFLLGK